MGTESVESVCSISISFWPETVRSTQFWEWAPKNVAKNRYAGCKQRIIVAVLANTKSKISTAAFMRAACKWQYSVNSHTTHLSFSCSSCCWRFIMDCAFVSYVRRWNVNILYVVLSRVWAEPYGHRITYAYSTWQLDGWFGWCATVYGAVADAALKHQIDALQCASRMQHRHTVRTVAVLLLAWFSVTRGPPTPLFLQ